MSSHSLNLIKVIKNYFFGLTIPIGLPDKFNFSYEPKEQTTYLWNSDKYICNAFFCCNKNENSV